jgi:hypothetical protein
MRHNCAGTHDGPLADGDATQYGCARPDGSTATDAGGDNLPVGFRLQFARLRGSAGISVVNEANVVTDETLVLDDDSFANKGVRADFASRSDNGVLLNLDERCNPRFVANGTSIQVHQLRVGNASILSQLDVVGDWHIDSFFRGWHAWPA